MDGGRRVEADLRAGSALSGVRCKTSPVRSSKKGRILTLDSAEEPRIFKTRMGSSEERLRFGKKPD
jgi:hypothetical protein